MYIFVKLRFYYRTHDSAQNGVQVEMFVMILWPVRNNANFKPQLICEWMTRSLVIKLRKSTSQT